MTPHKACCRLLYVASCTLVSLVSCVLLGVPRTLAFSGVLLLAGRTLFDFCESLITLSAMTVLTVLYLVAGTDIGRYIVELALACVLLFAHGTHLSTLKSHNISLLGDGSATYVL